MPTLAAQLQDVGYTTSAFVRMLFVEGIAEGVVMTSRWKLIQFGAEGSALRKLYDRNQGERGDLSAEFPEVRARLKAELERRLAAHTRVPGARYRWTKRPSHA